jgi:hypothetical protein
MDYIIYNRAGMPVARAKTEAEGKAHIDRLVATWRQLGRAGSGLSYKLCYNGIESVEVYSVTV